MSETGNSSNGANFWRLLEVIALRKRLIFAFVGLATVASVVVSLVLPEWYRAEALLLPPKEERMSVTSFGGDLTEWTSITGGLNLPVMATASDVYVRMLQSREVARRVIDSLGLVEYYGVATMTEALMALGEHTDFRVSPEGLILVHSEDKDPQRAADIANQFVAELDKIVKEISVSRTGQSQQFVERALASARSELDSARTALRSFQEKNRTIDLDKQTSIAISAAAELKAELATAEVEFDLKSRSLSPEHPELVDLTGKIAAIKSKIAELEFGSGDSSYFSLPVAETPRLTGQLAELSTRVQVAERLYENLRLRLDEIRVQAKREAPSVSALDRATPPEIRYRPQRTLIVGGTFMISLVLAVLLAAFFEYLVNLERSSPDDYRRARFFFESILGRRKS